MTDLRQAAQAVLEQIEQEPVATAHDCVLSNDDYHDDEVIEMGRRLFRTVETLAHRAGEDASEAVDWLCEGGGLFKLYAKYFSPTAAEQPEQP